VSASSRTSGRHLKLVPSSSASTGAARFEERLLIPPSKRLREFVCSAAEAGLDAPDAVRLALERALALVDAAAFGLDMEAARGTLTHAAESAQASRPLTQAQAAYVRSLGKATARPPAPVEEGLVVTLPDRVLTPARDTVSESAFQAAVVPEMLAWEIAAALEGRTMCEWALRTLARTHAAA
jgi:hypothetical protein